MRAYYSVPAKHFDPNKAAATDCIVVSKHGANLCILAPCNPHAGLESMEGAQLRGAKVRELPKAFQAHFTLTHVERRDPETGEVTPLWVPTCDLEDSDTAIEEDALVPRIVFAGDDPADYL